VLEEERRHDTYGHTVFGTAMSDLACAFVLRALRGVEGAIKQIRPTLPEDLPRAKLKEWYWETRRSSSRFQVPVPHIHQTCEAGSFGRLRDCFQY
jgi:hypothetical protein